jgi:hypothetical protein
MNETELKALSAQAKKLTARVEAWSGGKEWEESPMSY